MEPLIFVVDDDVFYQKYISAILKQINLNRIISYSSGEMFLSNIDKKPDLIILDHDLSGISGAEVLKEMNCRHNGFNVIMVSSHPEKELIENVINLGVKKYIKKDENLQKNLKEYFSTTNLKNVSVD